MRKLLVLPALMGALVFCLGGAAQANLLGNPSFADPAVGGNPAAPWVTVEGPLPSTNTLSQNSFGVNSNHDGTAGIFLQTFRGGSPTNAALVDGDLLQTVPHVPGTTTYVFSGWARFEVNSSLGAVKLDADHAHGGDNLSDEDGPLTPSRGEFAIEFLDAGNVMIGTSILVLNNSNQPNDNFGTNTTVADAMWKQHRVRGSNVPAGTASVRVRASMIDGLFNTDPSQSGFYDDFSLTAVPEPASVMLGLIGVLGLVGLMRRRR
ncbi:MAG: PEP-CTERM sorting domain-containing protein [Planctomycetes bacterium]|nr:PEP-CTERM sorting domain-containing protein [Planctomycetota bacterium]